MPDLYPEQKKVIEELAPGKVLFGIVGTGKTRTALGYYAKYQSPKRLIVITTAKKRDDLDWIWEATLFRIAEEERLSLHGKITVDSWQNIAKYEGIKDAFFIFDEQKTVGRGKWSASFLKIAKNNEWILLTGTPGDNWLDYATLFIANGWYKNISEFRDKHVVYSYWGKFPKVERYLSEHRLNVLRNEILVEMPYVKHTKPFLNWLEVEYDQELFKMVYERRWNPYENKPIRDISEMFRLMRKVVNSDPARVAMVRQIQQSHKKLIVFYNFDFELEALRSAFGMYEELENPNFQLAEWNGHKKEPIPRSDEWIYLVQYVAGAEGWNCIETDAMCFYSLTYSYKNFVQAMGRIDRLNTKFIDLFYYMLVSNSVIDRGIQRSLKSKEAFNERKFAREDGSLGLTADFF